MSWFDRSLGHRVRNKEEVKLAINNFRLLDETLVNISTLRRVLNKVLSSVTHSLLEKALAHTFIHDDKCDFRAFKFLY